MVGSTFPLWEIALGASNFILAAVVAWSTWRNAKKDRKVHVADKRMEWITEFRNAVSELLSAAFLARNGREELEPHIEKFFVLKAKLEMMDTKRFDEKQERLLQNPGLEFYIGDLEAYIKSESINTYDEIRTQIINRSCKAIETEWQKIRNLED